MSQLAAPQPALSGDAPQPLVSGAAVAVVGLSVFLLVCSILAYAAHQGRSFDPQALAREAAAEHGAAGAQVVRVETQPQQRP